MLASLITVALTILTGLTFIAYKHPIGYRKLYVPLVAFVGVVWFTRIIYLSGHLAGFFQALEGVRAINKGLVFQSPEHGQYPAWWTLLVLALAGYLSFLRALPSILELPDKEKPR
jgi:hypothetical protein